ncbi:MAG: haloacid dehalogenase [Chloroflexi bacterium]|nr:haloacid dehalogenase [Chloroflexota bacterium]
MEQLPQIAETIRLGFETRTQRRDQALLLSRQITRLSAQSIRATHRREHDQAKDFLCQAGNLVSQVKESLANFPDLYHTGYTQDGIKEYVEATITSALIRNEALPGPEDLEVEYATYLNGLAEVPGELRRCCLDILRQGYSAEAERLLSCMDEIYTVLVTMDFPDAITQGLRRQTDLVRGILERTRADLTLSLREEQVKSAMQKLINRLEQTNVDYLPPPDR